MRGFPQPFPPLSALGPEDVIPTAKITIYEWWPECKCSDCRHARNVVYGGRPGNHEQRMTAMEVRQRALSKHERLGHAAMDTIDALRTAEAQALAVHFTELERRVFLHGDWMEDTMTETTTAPQTQPTFTNEAHHVLAIKLREERRQMAGAQNNLKYYESQLAMAQTILEGRTTKVREFSSALKKLGVKKDVIASIK